MSMVKVAHITYGCLQVHFGISAKNTWSEIDGAFNYREFYNNIIELIEDSPDPDWKEDLLKAWNVKLFKNEEGHDNSSTRDDDKISGSCKGGDNDLARVHAQMTAHHTAKAISTPPTPAPLCEPTSPPPRKPASPPPHEPTRTRTPPKPKPAVPARAELHVPSDLTEAESCKDFEPMQIATKHKAKKAGGHSTKCKSPAQTPAQQSSRK
ncbi:uncharacterized protein HD556DRAFT_1442302 [Suillus plorans]|uniref:Uncharacterized protein n=1 Tax=Suillus plorans TaxID=116603 RepID=A0A9P7AS63_9AGAM|nr:uncharacterized protein HD556DRAFT_1442302 [Suillus plorans]KAG1795446.1 hypothetical protein HD556DRAFT_1442302 [Suillus plorans]